MNAVLLVIVGLLLCYCVGIVTYWTEKEFRDYVDQQGRDKRLILLAVGIIKSVMTILCLFTAMGGAVAITYVIKLIGG